MPLIPLLILAFAIVLAVGAEGTRPDPRPAGAIQVLAPGR